MVRVEVLGSVNSNHNPNHNPNPNLTLILTVIHVDCQKRFAKVNMNKVKKITASYQFNLQVVPFDVYFHYIHIILSA